MSTAAETTEQTEAGRVEFESIPPERIFFKLHMYIGKDGEPTGMVAYDGPALQTLGVPHAKAMECRVIGKMVAAAAQDAVNDVSGRVAPVLEMMEMLRDVMRREETNGDNSSKE